MNCEDAKKYIYPLLDNELDTETNIQVLAHLNVCERCQERFEAEKSFLNDLSNSLTDREVPEDTREEIQQRLQKARAERPLTTRIFSRLNQGLPVAAAALLVLAVGLVSYMAITLDTPPSSEQVLHTMPAYHDQLMASNKARFDHQVQTSNFQSRDSVEKHLAATFHPLQNQLNVPSLEQHQCKILDARASSRNRRFQVPSFHVVYCYRPERQKQKGFTYLVLKRPMFSDDILSATDKVRKTDSFYYIPEHRSSGGTTTVFWGNEQYTFAVLSHEIPLEHLLDIASTAREQGMTTSGPPSSGNHF